MANPEKITQQQVTVKRERQLQYERYFQLAKMGPIIPGLHQDLVPQGITYMAQKDWLIMSFYRTGNSASVLAIVEAASGEYVKAVHLQHIDGTPYVGHAGGVAVSDGFLFVSSDHTLFYTPLHALVNAENEAPIQFTGSLPMETRGSFAKVAEGTLWVGEFAFSGAYLTRENHHLYNRNNVLYQGWMLGYVLDPVTGFIPADTPLDEDGQYVPDYILSIPYRIQGMSISESHIVLSQSYGRTADSHLFIYSNPLETAPHQYVTVGGEAVPVWFLDNTIQTDTLLAPPMSESIVLKDNDLYVLYESASDKYVHDCSYPLDRLGVIDMNRLTQLGGEDECDETCEENGDTNVLIGNKKIGKQIINHIQNMHDLYV